MQGGDVLMPRDPKTGKIDPFKRRAFRGCQKLCLGFKGKMAGSKGKPVSKKKPFPRCMSVCMTTAQKGSKRGFTRIPKRGAKTVKKSCPKAGIACLKKALKARLRTPKTRDRG
jgi:hypothetical protein